MTAGVRIAVAGALGRMGQAVAEVLRDHPRAVLAAVFDRPGAEGVAGGLAMVSQEKALAAADVVIEFSAPEAAVAMARACAGRGVSLVTGTTGLNEADERAIREAAERIAVVRSGNFSLGVNLLAGLVRQAARALGPDYDIEILEAHHRRKADAPSGTALMLGEAAAEGRGVDLAANSERVRDGRPGPRAPGAIGFSAVRGGGIVGEHSVMFAAEDEIITLGHSARDRSLFARGAVAAAVWAAGRKPGLYGMDDVLELER
ncbi:MAG: 4-hydroxy-tetrahydrodipicolinate reductase [Caulobacteraceae bacterium]